jgi:septal ring factor EnvC (AmiA/AmiB activator)
LTEFCRFLPVWLIFTSTFAFLAAVPAVAAEGDNATSPNAARDALQEIVSKLNDLDSWFSDADEQRIRWLKEVQEQDIQVATLSSSAQDADLALKTIQARIAELQTEHSQLESLRNQQAQKISQHLAAAHRLGGQDFVKLLLNQQTPETFDRMLRYHGYFSKARATTLQAYQNTLADLHTNQTALTEQAAQQQDTYATLVARQKALLAKRGQRKVLIAELDAQREDKEVQRQRLLADRSRLEKLLAELNRRATTLDGSAFLAGKGALPWPLKGPIRSTFGRPRADGRLVWHGMVVSAEEGTPITAVFRGRVIFADWLRGFGLLTIIDHGSGFMTLYGHADSLTKVLGDWVEAGERIARAGRSGGQTKSGLYFEIRQKGTARDPLGWLAKRET